MSNLARQLASPTIDTAARDAADLLHDLRTLQAAVAQILDTRDNAPVVDRMTWCDVSGAFASMQRLQIIKPKRLAQAREAVEDMLDPLDSCGPIGRQNLCALFDVMSRASAYACDLVHPAVPAPTHLANSHASRGQGDRSSSAQTLGAVVDLFRSQDA